MALIVELADEQFTVQAIHRLIDGLPPDFDVPAALAPWFDVTPTAPADRTITTRMAEAEAVAVLTRRGAWLARPLPLGPRRPPMTSTAAALDVALAGLPSHHLAYQHGWDNAAAAVATGQADAAVLLRPATVEPDRRRQPGPAADAGQDHLLLAQAPDRSGRPGAAGLSEPSLSF